MIEVQNFIETYCTALNFIPKPSLMKFNEVQRRSTIFSGVKKK